MSGGISYVYDVERNFDSLCNMEMVDLDTIESDDEKLLREMIQKHYQYTNSTVAKFILNDFENQLKNFVKVFPKDYKRILMQNKQMVEVNKVK